MNLYDIMFFVQFLVLIGIVIFEIYNLTLAVKNKYPIRYTFISFILMVVVFGVGFITAMLGYEDMLFIQLFKLETLLFLTGLCFFVVELFLYFGTAGRSIYDTYSPRK